MQCTCMDTLQEVRLFTPKVFQDERGFFLESYHQDKLVPFLGDVTFVQDNHSRSVKGVLRGLHYQTHQPQGKWVRVTSGEIFDVAVDLRRSSPTFGKWVGMYLSASNYQIAWIPPGFAHGFLTLSDQADVLYKATAPYDPSSDRSLLWNDPEIGIEWPLGDMIPQLSPKDRAAKRLCEAECFS